jgi:hypothetical protein
MNLEFFYQLYFVLTIFFFSFYVHADNLDILSYEYLISLHMINKFYILVVILLVFELLQFFFYESLLLLKYLL